MAKNTKTITDEDGTFSDWIEIHNGSSCAIDLNNWCLTDNPDVLTKWRFPSTNIEAGQFIVVWASDKNRRTPGAPLHTNFKMADEGEYLALVQADGLTIATQFYPTFVPQLPDVSYGLPADAPTNTYLAWATPGYSNSPATNFAVANLELQPGSGWFTSPVSVSAGTATPGVTIYYTTNGAVPNSTNGYVYTGPLTFSNTTVLRVAAYRPAYVPNVATRTYIFPETVAFQSGASFPTNWGFTNGNAIAAYYSFNSNMVNDPKWSNQIPAALLSVPTVSVVMNPDDMFGTNGIYSNPWGDGVEWERPCSVEYLRPDSGPGFQIDCGMRIQGDVSRDPTITPKHNLRLLFKQIYGASKLLYKLYPGSPVNEFDTLVLHASSADHWLCLGRVAQMHRDQWCADTQEETGGYDTHGTYVQLYINGLYWGLYNLGERADAAYAARYLGGKKSDYDAIKGGELKDGTTNAWNELITLAQAGITNEVAYSNACYYLDVPAFIDYVLINFYADNVDWIPNNYWVDGSVSHGVPFHFFSWDAEETFFLMRGNIDLTGMNAAYGPIGIFYSSLRQYPGFVRLFGDHAQRMLFNRGALTPDLAVARWMKRAREIDLAVVSETARWGLDTNWWGYDGVVPTYSDWIVERDFLVTNWIPQHTEILISRLRNAGLYPALDAPVFSPHGGIIVDSLPVTISIPPETSLCYTTNGTDPSLPTGAISPDAFVSDHELTLVLSNACQLQARAFVTNSGSALVWSALVQASYSRSSQFELRITQATLQNDKTMKLDFLVWPDASYTLWASTTLQNSSWEPIAPVVPFVDGTFTFVDTAATNYPARFYRLTWP